jgi:hypothetical protein
MAAGCQPSTTRPAFTPVPEAATTEVRLPTREATRRLAEALRAGSVPVTRVELRDGYLETAWFEAASGRPADHRPLGSGVVRVRAWADPSRPGFTRLTAEATYRPLADPSLPERELEREVPRDHPVAVKVRAALQDLVKRYGGPPSAEAQQPAVGRPPPAEPGEPTEDEDR